MAGDFSTRKICVDPTQWVIIHGYVDDNGESILSAIEYSDDPEPAIYDQYRIVIPSYDPAMTNSELVRYYGEVMRAVF